LIIADSTLSADVNFEDGGANDEAPVNIAKVIVSLVNSQNEMMGESKTFTVTAPTATDGTTTYAMTNGFYEAISGYDSNYYVRYNANAAPVNGGNATIDIAKLGTFTSNGNGYDNNLTTVFGGGNNPYTNGFAVTRPWEKFDRVVLWVGSGYYVDGIQTYVSTLNPVSANSASTSEQLKAFYDLFTTDKNDASIQYLGTVSGHQMAVDAVGARNVWNVDGGYTYGYIMCRYNNGVENCGGEIREMQGFKKFVDTQTVAHPSEQ